uniref:L-serine ammonia-lyase n=1 Tax=Ciona savignyi TaxID=51511 RepID=H2YW48_CIOSA
MSHTLGIDIFFKKEFMQFTGSFKDRGAIYSLLNLSEEQRLGGVVTTSAGNHAQALAYQGRKLNIPVTVVMPNQAPLVKVNSCKDLQATVILHGDRFDQAKAYAMAYGKKHNLLYINGYDHPDILAGQGTVGLEILEDVPDVDCIVVPVGGGGLIAGIAAAVKHLKPNTKIIGVESQRCPSWTTAESHGRPVPCPISKKGAKNSISDGLSVIEVGVNSYATAHPLMDKIVTVSEDYICLAILQLLENEKSVVEGAGAAGFAAILAGLLPELKGQKVVTVLCGGNIDITVLGRVIDRALMMQGRLCRFNCVISDRAGGLAEMLSIIAENGASVKDIMHDRMSLPSFVYKTSVRMTVETRDQSHATQLRTALHEHYGGELNWKAE